MNDIVYKEQSYKFIGACMEVFNELGCGYLEAVYQESLEIEFQLQNIPYTKEHELAISYKGTPLNKKYSADFICYDAIIVELKALNKLLPEHESQVLNYLKATGYKLGLLVNFGESSLKYKRLAY